jgi:hypothetical protein
MANDLVGRFNPTTPDRIARLAGKAVIQPLLMTLQRPDHSILKFFVLDVSSGRGW